jgi:hypothetical protein
MKKATAYGLYSPTSELIKTFRNKKSGLEALYKELGNCELRTFYFLTEKQIQALTYHQAVSIELTALSK